MTLRRRLALFLFLSVSVAVPALGEPRIAFAAPTSTEDQRKAQDHFQRARELYQQGNYTKALDELEVARGLDPKAKDLVMNLGIVSEKLGKYDEAIGWFKTFLAMDDITSAEKNRADGFIKRIEGAKKEQAAKNPPAPPPTASATTTALPPPPPPPVNDENGRFDGATIGVGAVAAVALAAGTTFGILALAKQPSDFVTGRDGSFADLQSQTDTAHTMAIVADVGLGVGIVAAIATLYLYFGRSKESAPTKTGRFTLGTVTF